MRRTPKRDPFFDLLVQPPIHLANHGRVLAAQPDRSVAISSVGLLTNLAALLRSGPDDNSPLDGRALVAQKVGTVCIHLGHCNVGRKHGVTKSVKSCFSCLNFKLGRSGDQINTQFSHTKIRFHDSLTNLP